MHSLSPRPPRLRHSRGWPRIGPLIIATLALAISLLTGAAAATPTALRHAAAAVKHAALSAASATAKPSSAVRSAAHHASRTAGTPNARISASTTMLLSQSLTNYGTERGAPIATSVNTAHCLDAGQFSAGSGLYLWDCNAQPQQSFSWSTEGLLRVSLNGGTLCLQDRGGAAANGDVVELATCTGAWNQRWEPHDDGVSIRLAGTGRCLDLAGANLANGSVIQIWDCWGGTNQHWLANDPTFTGSVLAEVDVPEFHTGATMERSGCPVFGIVEDLASECGSIRVTHAIPSITTYGKTRTPVLVHYGDETLNTPIEVNFTLPAAAAVPDSVRFDLYRVDSSGATGALLQSRAWPSGIFASGRSKRIGFLGLFPASNTITRFEVNVVLRYGSQQLPAAPRIRGEVAYVNRMESPFGAGWWLAGLEQLVPGQYDGSILWIDGDGSTRKYADTHRTRPADGAAVFLTRELDRPDSLLYYPASGTYIRVLPHRAYTQFNAAGQHVNTVDRFGRVTTFQYSGSVLSSITVPSPSGGVPYTVQTTGSGIVTSITAPAVGGPQRVVQLVRKPNGDGTPSRGVERLIDWHGATSDTVSFTFQPWATDFSYASRTDRRGTKVTLGAETYAATLTDAWVDSTGLSIHHHWRTPHGFLTFPGADPEPVGEARYFYDGPRSDVADTSSIWVDRWGAPVMIRNALGQTTAISRSDARFPALATSVTAPNGFLTSASYDGAGRPAQQVAHSPYGDARDAVTSYAYDGIWGDMTRIIGPEGDSTTYGIDPATGLRTWLQDGRGDSTRVNFSYTSGRQLEYIQPPGNTTLQREHYEYDAMGNLARATSPLGFATQYFRDGLGRDTLVLTPTDAAQTPGLMRRDRTVYNLAERVDSTIATGAAMSYTLRSIARDTATVEPDSAFTSYSYDATGRMISQVTRPSFSAWGDRRVTPSETWSYDALGRVRVHIHNAGKDSTVYDPAGNAIQIFTGTRRFLTQAFDPLNRLIGRVDAARTMPRQRCEGLLTGPITDPNVLSQCYVVFPAYPSASDGSYTIPRDSATFGYDISGAMILADNGDARIHRQYYPNGAVRVDSTLYRAANGTGFTHASRLAYHYDRAGRRDTLFVPDGGAMAFAYRPDNGALSTIVDPLATMYRYAYDPAGRIDSLIVGASGVMEHRAYDADGRQYARQRTSGVFGLLNAEQLTFDAQGRVTTAAFSTRANQAPSDSTFLSYAGLGAVLARERRDVTGNWETEEFRTDGLGNVLRSRSELRDLLAMPQMSSYASRGALVNRVALPNPDYAQEFDQLVQFPDADGHVVRSHRKAIDRANTITTDTPTQNYHGWDGRLRAVQRYRIVSSGQDGTWEEYRYDALGRRVLTIARPSGTPPGCATAGMTYCAPLCSVVCIDAVTWARYDGDQLVREERRAYPDGSVAPPSFGIVQYVPGLSLDAPLAAIRDGSSLYVLTPHWRGRAESSVDATGAAKDATLAAVGGPSVRIAWPVGDAVYQRPAPMPDAALPITWMGSGVTDQQDGTGYQYRRNRYYNPESGQFTQEDPIGLAGGMNLYGFAGGDPVNFSDPFGLCPPCYPGMFGMQPLNSDPKVGLAVLGGVLAVALAPVAIEAVGVGMAVARFAPAGTAAASKIPFADFQKWGQTAVGWGQNAAGAAKAMADMTAEKALTLDPSKVQAAKTFYENAVADGKGGAAAGARVELMQKILSYHQ
ncbi:hypothetical protein BH11GEM2_BH11GEM2_05720 [soil metagenome]